MQDAKKGASLSALKTASRGAATVISPAKFKATVLLGLGLDRCVDCPGNYTFACKEDTMRNRPRQS
jgi:hypothetical protein